MVSTTERKGRRSGAPGTRLLSLAGVKITKAWVDAVYPGFRDGGGGGGGKGEKAKMLDCLSRLFIIGRQRN